MLVIRTEEELANLDPTIAKLLQPHCDRLRTYTEFYLFDLAHFLVAEPGDRLETITTTLGFSGSWETITANDGWFELVFIVSDDGFGWVVFIPDVQGVDAELLALCRAAGN